jgi:hypothetical protein
MQETESQFAFPTPLIKQGKRKLTLYNLTLFSAVMQQIMFGIWQWKRIHEKTKQNLYSYALTTDDGTILIDPFEPNDEEQEELDALGDEIKYIFLTSKLNERDAGHLQKKFEAKVYVHESDAKNLSFTPDETFKEGSELPKSMIIIPVDGSVSPGETAFYDQMNGSLFTGAGIVGGEDTISFPKSVDVNKAKESLKKTLPYDFVTIYTTVGKIVVDVGKEVMEKFLKN